MRIQSYLAGIAVPLLAMSASAGISQLNISYYGDYGATVVAQGSSHNTYATGLSADRVGGDPLPVPHTDPFVTFCLDINANLGNGYWKSGSFSDVALTSDSTPADRVEAGLYRAASLYRHYVPADIGNAANKLTAAALQLAIWEVLYEKGGVGYSIDENGAIPNASEFYVSSVDNSVRTLANTMLASAWNVADTSLTTTFWNATDAAGNKISNQDLIGPVPEPTTYLAGALLLLPFVLGGVRRKFAA